MVKTRKNIQILLSCERSSWQCDDQNLNRPHPQNNGDRDTPEPVGPMSSRFYNGGGKSLKIRLNLRKKTIARIRGRFCGEGWAVNRHEKNSVARWRKKTEPSTVYAACVVNLPGEMAGGEIENRFSHVTWHFARTNVSRHFPIGRACRTYRRVRARVVVFARLVVIVIYWPFIETGKRPLKNAIGVSATFSARHGPTLLGP